jgi:hypothetical protein
VLLFDYIVIACLPAGLAAWAGTLISVDSSRTSVRYDQIVHRPNNPGNITKGGETRVTVDKRDKKEHMFLFDR